MEWDIMGKHGSQRDQAEKYGHCGASPSRPSLSNVMKYMIVPIMFQIGLGLPDMERERMPDGL
jgi:hypothetical protein